jgi:hypothetical protein
VSKPSTAEIAVQIAALQAELAEAEGGVCEDPHTSATSTCRGCPRAWSKRVGRAARPGAVRGWVQTYIPDIRDAGIAHVVSILFPRGGEHHQVLDSYEGVAAADSTTATRLGQIAARSPNTRTKPATPAPPPR